MTRRLELIAACRAGIGPTRHTTSHATPAPVAATALDATCPHCGAGPRQSCTNPGTGKSLRSGNHPSRTEAAKGGTA